MFWRTSSCISHFKARFIILFFLTVRLKSTTKYKDFFPPQLFFRSVFDACTGWFWHLTFSQSVAHQGQGSNFPFSCSLMAGCSGHRYITTPHCGTEPTLPWCLGRVHCIPNRIGHAGVSLAALHPWAAQTCLPLFLLEKSSYTEMKNTVLWKEVCREQGRTNISNSFISFHCTAGGSCTLTFKSIPAVWGTHSFKCAYSTSRPHTGQRRRGFNS